MLKLPKPGKPSRSDAPASILIAPFGNTDLMRLEILREGLRQNLKKERFCRKCSTKVGMLVGR